MANKIIISRVFIVCVGLVALLNLFSPGARGEDLEKIRETGVLRHLGVPYANFVTGSGDGMDVELMRLFAESLGVEYRYVPCSWKSVIGDLTGKQVRAVGDDVEIVGSVPVRGDVIANGFTILDWRRKIVRFSSHTFPTQVWLVARADSHLTPIQPSGDTDRDIAAVKKGLKGLKVFGVLNTCLDPALYNIENTGAVVRLFEGNVNELAPAVVNGEADATLLDVPDALIALEKWPGKVKVIGPVSEMQGMGVAFDKSSVELCEAFEIFLERCRDDGIYTALVKKYYPAVFRYYPEFFRH